MKKQELTKSQLFKAESEVIEILKYKIPFKLFFLCPTLFNGCSFKTIERVRRKIQADHPELKDEYIAEKRFEAQQIYEQYSLNM